MGTPLEESRLKAILSQIYAQDDSDPELYAQDEFRMYAYKVLPCHKRYGHDWTECPFAHPGEKATRRCPKAFSYSPLACPNMKKTGECPRGDGCMFAHNVFEYWLHPSRYRTQLCSYGLNCKRSVCFFAHHFGQLRMAEQFARVQGMDAAAPGLSEADFGAFGVSGAVAVPFGPPSGGTVAVVPASQVQQVRSAAAAALANRQALAKVPGMPRQPVGGPAMMHFQQTQQVQVGGQPGSTMALVGGPGEPLRLVHITDGAIQQEQQQQQQIELVQLAPAQQQQQGTTYVLQQTGALPAGMIAAQGIVASRGGYGYQPMGAALQQLLQQQQQVQQQQQAQQQQQQAQQQQVANAQRLAAALHQQQHAQHAQQQQQQQATPLVASGSTGSSSHDGHTTSSAPGTDEFHAAMQHQHHQSLQMLPSAGMDYQGSAQGQAPQAGSAGNGGNVSGLEPSEVATAIKVLQQLLADKGGNSGGGTGHGDSAASSAELDSAMQHDDLVSAVSAFVMQRKATSGGGGAANGEADSDGGKDTMKHVVAGLLPQLLNQLSATADQQRLQQQRQKIMGAAGGSNGGARGQGLNVPGHSGGVPASNTSRSSSGASMDAAAARAGTRTAPGFSATGPRGPAGMPMQTGSFDSGSTDLGMGPSMDLDQLLLSIGLQQVPPPPQMAPKHMHHCMQLDALPSRHTANVLHAGAQPDGMGSMGLQHGCNGYVDAQLAAQLRALGVSDQQRLGLGLGDAGQEEQVYFGRAL